MLEPELRIEVCAVMDDGRRFTQVIKERLAGEDITSLPNVSKAKMIVVVLHGISRIYFKAKKYESGMLEWKVFNDKMEFQYEFETKADGTKV